MNLARPAQSSHRMHPGDIDQLFRQHAALLERQLARQYPRIADAAADAVQHAFSKLTTTDTVVQEPIRWVARSASNYMIDLLRRGRRIASLDEQPVIARSAASPPDIALEDEDERARRARILQRGLTEIDEPMRSALIMMYMQGRNYREIADATGLALSSVGTILLRGRKRLRALVERDLRGWQVESSA
jgi:RNA polymerase sigma factor (sigma-70 family)